jgi:hypothetical protein
MREAQKKKNDAKCPTCQSINAWQDDREKWRCLEEHTCAKRRKQKNTPHLSDRHPNWMIAWAGEWIVHGSMQTLDSNCWEDSWENSTENSAKKIRKALSWANAESAKSPHHNLSVRWSELCEHRSCRSFYVECRFWYVVHWLRGHIFFCRGCIQSQTAEAHVETNRKAQQAKLR